MGSHAIDQLLSKEDTTIVDLLNDDSIIQETRSQNAKLLDFLTPDKIEYLIELITVFPKELEDVKRTQNHPFIASEMLSESGPIHDKIFENEALMSKFFAFLSSENVNPTLAGYFSKVAIPFIARFSEGVISYLHSGGFFPKLVRNLNTRSMMDVILKIVLIESQSSLIEERKELVQILIDHLKNIESSDLTFVGSVLIEILNKTMEISSWVDLVGVIVSRNNLEVYLEALGSMYYYKSIAAANIVKSLFTVNLRVNLKVTFADFELVEVFIQHLPELSKNLESSPGSFQTTYSENAVVLGEKRLRIIELLHLSLKLENEAVYHAVVSSGIFARVIKLFFEIPMNSILHNATEICLMNAVNTRNPDLIQSALVDSQFLASTVEHGINKSTKKLGFLGHLTRLGNTLNSSSCELVKSKLSTTPNWNQFIKEFIEPQISLESKQLGGTDRKDSSSESDKYSDEIILPTIRNMTRDKVVVPNAVSETPAEKEDSQEPEASNMDIDKTDSEEQKKTEHFSEVVSEIINVVSLEELAPERKLSGEADVQVSPNKIYRRSSSSGSSGVNRSPNLDPQFNETNFWRLIVDELDLEEI